jgi:CPA2 family monovalent cation:H+ antiporter-2/glutathione-regulated potassium-efflux system ancillary protein KefC/glutathione-regulated potassium-efflux system protein KefB
MGEGGFFYQAFIYLTAAVISVPIAKRLGLGSVLGYLIAGVAIGPFALDLVGERGQDIMHFAEFGVVMMLFLVGLELEPSLVWRMRAPILGLGGLQVIVTAVVIALCGVVLGFAWQTALAIGLTLALSSTAIILQTLSEKGLMPTRAGQSAFSVLLFQDIAVIPILAVLPLLAVESASHSAVTHAGGHGPETWVEGMPAWAQTLAVIGAVAGVVLVGRFLVVPVLRMVGRTRLREIFTAASLLLVIGIALLMSRVGLSPALGTFLAGVVLANSEYRHQLEADIEPFKGLLLGLFFIAVGASIDFKLIAGDPGLIASLVAGLVAVKLILLLILGRLFKLSLDQNLLFGFALAQGGEFAFVLFSFASQSEVLDEEVVAPLMAVVAVSMAIAPLLMLVNEKLIQPRFGTLEAEPREADDIHGASPVIIAGFGRFGHIVGRLLLANGVGTTVLDVDSDQVDMLRKLGLKVFYGDAGREDLLRAAGAEKAKVLIVAVDGKDKALEIVQTAHEHFPHLRILSRAHGRPHAYDLLEAGVDHVYRETLDTSLKVGVDSLCMLGYRRHQALRAARKFRRHDEESVRELAGMWKDRKAYILRARELIQSVQRLIREEVAQGRTPELDAAWDTTGLVEEYGEKQKRSD